MNIKNTIEINKVNPVFSWSSAVALFPNYAAAVFSAFIPSLIWGALPN